MDGRDCGHLAKERSPPLNPRIAFNAILWILKKAQDVGAIYPVKKILADKELLTYSLFSALSTEPLLALTNGLFALKISFYLSVIHF